MPNADQSRRQKAPAHTLMRLAAFAKPATWSRGFSTTGILHRTHGAVRSAAGIAGRNFPLAQLFIASLIAADANKQRSAARFDDIDREAIARTRRSVREYLDTWMRLPGAQRASRYRPQAHPAPRPAQAEGPSAAQDEFLLAATAQNLRKLSKLIPLPAPMPARA